MQQIEISGNPPFTLFADHTDCHANILPGTGSPDCHANILPGAGSPDCHANILPGTGSPRHNRKGRLGVKPQVTYFQAMDTKTTKFNQKQTNILVLHLIFHRLAVVYLSLCNLKREITPTIRMLGFVLINRVLFNLLFVWILLNIHKLMGPDLAFWRVVVLTSHEINI